MEVLVVVQDPAEYRAAIDAWRRTATVVQELPPWVALAEPRGEVPDVPGTRWYTGAVPPDVLLTLAPAARSCSLAPSTDGPTAGTSLRRPASYPSFPME